MAKANLHRLNCTFLFQTHFTVAPNLQQWLTDLGLSQYEQNFTDGCELW